MRSPLALLSGILGLAPHVPPRASGLMELDDRLIPFVHVRGLPSEVVVVDGQVPPEEARATGAVRLPRALENLSRLCRHREGFDCGVCRDAIALSEAVWAHGRVRALPSG